MQTVIFRWRDSCKLKCSHLVIPQRTSCGTVSCHHSHDTVPVQAVLDLM